MLLIGPNGTLSEPRMSQITSPRHTKKDVPKPCKLLYPMISRVLQKYVRDYLNEFCPVFHTCIVIREFGIISEGRVLEYFLR
jgi:hypothetical protein